MAAAPSRYVISLVLSILTLLVIIYYFTYPWKFFTLQFNFFVLVASLPYTAYMFFYEFKQDKRQNLERGLITQLNKNFMIDIYSKFLFPCLFACFYYGLVILFQTNFGLEYDTFLHYLCQIYIGVVLPFFAIVEIYATPRRRAPQPITDMVILGLIIACHCGYSIAILILSGENVKVVAPRISNYFIFALVTLNGYVLYDYLIHKKRGGADYVLLQIDPPGSAMENNPRENLIRNENENNDGIGNNNNGENNAEDRIEA